MTHFTDFITPSLLARYDKPGPRYTSYPTALEFHPNVTASDYRRHLSSLAAEPEPLSIYIHIPFCKSRCHFCGCHTAICSDVSQMEVYVDHICKEIDLLYAHLGKQQQLAAVHFGGGTPTYLANEQLYRIVHKLTESFQILANAEVSIEVNPHVSSNTQIEFLASLGFNRLSVGVQDFNPEVLAAIGRQQDKTNVLEIIETARSVGFRSINVDLIYGLPYQTQQSFAQTLKEIISIKPDRVALYSFAYIPWIRDNQTKLQKDALPNRDEKFSLFAMSLKTFLKNDYLQIGMDHFALSTDELGKAALNGTLFRNFMGYTVTRSKNILGIGVSSIGFVNGAFFQNEKDNRTYYNSLNDEILPIFKGLVLSTDDLIRASVITELMCNFRLDIAALEQRWKICFQNYFAKELHELEVQRSDEYPFTQLDSALWLTDAGKLFVRNVCMIFDTYLKTKNENRQVFSRTV